MYDREHRRRFLKTMAAWYAATAFGYPANEMRPGLSARLANRAIRTRQVAKWEGPAI